MLDGKILETHGTTRAAPVGKCIYCDGGIDLTDEHIIPLGLGGNLILPKASCLHCNAITSKFEREVLRGFMQEARIAGTFPSRRPRQRPKTLSIKARRDGCFEPVILDADKSFGLLHLPILDRAQFLMGVPPTRGVAVTGVETLLFGQRPETVIASLGTDSVQAAVTWDITAFVRLLAKIGYAAAVASCGSYPLAEVPVLPLIRGDADDGGMWIGSNRYTLLVESKSPKHAVGFLELDGTIEGRNERVLVAQVKLFADTGATGYEIIVRRRIR